MPVNADPEKVRNPPYFWCRCPDCQCDAKTQYETKICYTCRGGSGVALIPREPAHHRKPRTEMPVPVPVRNEKK